MDDFYSSLAAGQQESAGSALDTPSYMKSADLHNIGSQGDSWFSDVYGSIKRAPEFFKVSALSGVNSFYNSGVQIGNLFGAKAEERDTASWISSIDSNLGTYYEQNTQSADMMGFMLGSLIPGMAGVKVLNAGQKALLGLKTGKVGGNLGAALGLNTAKADLYIAQAATEIATSQFAYGSLRAGGVKALSTGIYQNVLEGIAFETAVQASMSASPVLAEQSKSDILWNIATGGLLGGVIGGAIHSAVTIGKIGREANVIAGGIRAQSSKGLLRETGRVADDISFLARDLETGPTELIPGAADYAAKVEALERRQVSLNLDMRKKTHLLVKGEQSELGNAIADINYGSSADEVLHRMDSTREITHAKGATKVEEYISKLAKEGVEGDPALQVHYWKLQGEDAGIVVSGAEPVVLNLADNFAQASKKSVRDQVLDKVREQKHSKEVLHDSSKASLVADTGHMLEEGRRIWATHILAPLKAGAKVGYRDIPLLQKALSEQMLDISVVGTRGKVVSGFSDLGELKDFVLNAKKEVATELQRQAVSRGKGLDTELLKGRDLELSQDWVNNKIAKITDTEVGAMLEGTKVTEKGMFASRKATEDYAELLKSKGLKFQPGQETESEFRNTWAKVTKVVDNRDPVSGHVVDGMAYHATMQQLASEATDSVAAKVLGDLHGQLAKIEKKDLAEISISGVGAGMFKFSNPTQGGLGSKMAMSGSVAQRASEAGIKAFTSEVQSAVYNLASKPEAVIEWSLLQQKASRTAQQWTTAPAGDIKGLVSVEAVKQAKAAGIPVSEMFLADLAQRTGKEHLLPITHAETLAMVGQHIKATNSYVSVSNDLAAASGRELSKQLGIFRPIPPDPSQYKHFAFVKDPKVTGQGHTSMIFAENETKLKELMAKAKEARPDLDIHVKADTQEYFEAYNSYKYDRTLSEHSIDSSLKNEGIFSEYFPKTNPQRIVDDFMNYHSSRIDMQVKEVIRAKYQPEFNWLEDQAKNFSRSSTSKFGGSIEAIEASTKNPYLSYIKTGLNLSRANENALWYGANKAADEAVSSVVAKVQDLWGSIKGGVKDIDGTAEATNKLLKQYGLNTGYIDSATQLLVNEKVPKGELTKFVRAANSFLGRVTLGMDPLNAAVNAISSNLLRVTELTHMLRAVKEGNPEIAGKLTQLLEMDITGKGDFVLSPMKLSANAYKAYAQIKMPGAPQELIQEFRAAGFIRDATDQFHAGLDLLTLKGSESVIELSKRKVEAAGIFDKLAQKAETWTGNKHAEEMNRFVSAHTMYQLTQPLVEAGRLSKSEQYAYINTHVNRVEGTIVASQRPFVFQGPIGQAVGLFQSYQFNLMQQMFRYVAEGSKKDAAMMLGLQGTLFGIQGLPGFQAINQHIIGTASGNKNHTDIYDATYGVAGKNIGDMLMYGIPSNLLQTNLYSRGDINPRNVTILPTALKDVPAISATMKFFGSMKESAQKVAAGGNLWETTLQGIEHSGISRPLGGLAQVMQATTGAGYVMSTTTKGNIMYQNDLMSLATLSRLAGGRPLDEALVNDSLFRMHSYAEHDRKDMNLLKEAIKTTSIGGQDGSGNWDVFAKKYAEAGGKQINFNKFMVNTLRSANVNDGEKIIREMKSPLSQKVQLIMGGSPNAGLEDLN